MLELWNDGFKENKTQSAYYSIDFLVLMAYFMGQEAENRCRMSIIKKCSFNIFCRIGCFPLFRPSLPKFHYSIIPCGLPKEWPQKAL